jgi:hypothetical protein
MPFGVLVSSGDGGGGAGWSLSSPSGWLRMRRVRLFRGLDAEALKALVRSSAEKESLRGRWTPLRRGEPGTEGSVSDILWIESVLEVVCWVWVVRLWVVSLVEPSRSLDAGFVLEKFLIASCLICVPQEFVVTISETVIRASEPLLAGA